MDTPASSPLTNLQVELLKVFSRNIPDDDLREIRQLISSYFARKATALADEIWDEEGFTDETMREWQQTHQRTPYTPLPKPDPQ